MSRARNPWGTLIVDPSRLDRVGRVQVIAEVALYLEGPDRPIGQRWAGARIRHWLDVGGNLEEVLGVRPVRGDTSRPNVLLRQRQIDSLVDSLAIATGSNTAAARVIRGQAEAPEGAAPILAEIRRLGRPPRTAQGVGAARKRASR